MITYWTWLQSKDAQECVRALIRLGELGELGKCYVSKTREEMWPLVGDTSSKRMTLEWLDTTHEFSPSQLLAACVTRRAISALNLSKSHQSKVAFNPEYSRDVDDLAVAVRHELSRGQRLLLLNYDSHFSQAVSVLNAARGSKNVIAKAAWSDDFGDMLEHALKETDRRGLTPDLIVVTTGNEYESSMTIDDYARAGRTLGEWAATRESKVLIARSQNTRASWSAPERTIAFVASLSRTHSAACE